MTKHLTDPVGYLEKSLSAADMAVANRHLAVCSVCADGVRRLERTIGRLTATACDARTVCPSGEQIAGYVFGGLPATELKSVRRHESRCDSCRREIDLLRKAAQAAAAPAKMSTLPADLAVAAERMKKQRLAERLKRAVETTLGKQAARVGDFVGKVEELLNPRMPLAAAASKRHLSGDTEKSAVRKKVLPKTVQPGRKKAAAAKPKAGIRRKAGGRDKG